VPQTLSEIVLGERLATTEEVKTAANTADKERVPLIVALVRDFGVDEVTLVGALRKATRVPVVDPSTLEVDSDAIRRLSRELCKRLRVIPLSLATYDSDGPLMKLAMADPTDTVAIAEVEHHGGCRVEPSVATLSAVEELIEANYRHIVTEVMARKPEGMARSRPNPVTVPFHRVTDEADLDTRLRALVKLLLDKGVIREEEYEEAIRELLKQRSSNL
jgi:hypothetical protein